MIVRHIRALLPVLLLLALPSSRALGAAEDSSSAWVTPEQYIEARRRLKELDKIEARIDAKYQKRFEEVKKDSYGGSVMRVFMFVKTLKEELKTKPDTVKEERRRVEKEFEPKRAALALEKKKYQSVVASKQSQLRSAYASLDECTEEVTALRKERSKILKDAGPTDAIAWAQATQLSKKIDRKTREGKAFGKELGEHLRDISKRGGLDEDAYYDFHRFVVRNAKRDAKDREIFTAIRGVVKDEKAANKATAAAGSSGEDDDGSGGWHVATFFAAGVAASKARERGEDPMAAAHKSVVMNTEIIGIPLNPPTSGDPKPGVQDRDLKAHQDQQNRKQLKEWADASKEQKTQQPTKPQPSKVTDDTKAKVTIVTDKRKDPTLEDLWKDKSDIGVEAYKQHQQEQQQKLTDYERAEQDAGAELFWEMMEGKHKVSEAGIDKVIKGDKPLETVVKRHSDRKERDASQDLGLAKSHQRVKESADAGLDDLVKAKTTLNIGGQQALNTRNDSARKIAEQEAASGPMKDFLEKTGEGLSEGLAEAGEKGGKLLAGKVADELKKHKKTGEGSSGGAGAGGSGAGQTVQAGGGTQTAAASSGGGKGGKRSRNRHSDDSSSDDHHRGGGHADASGVPQPDLSGLRDALGRMDNMGRKATQSTMKRPDMSGVRRAEQAIRNRSTGSSGGSGRSPLTYGDDLDNNPGVGGGGGSGQVLFDPVTGKTYRP